MYICYQKSRSLFPNEDLIAKQMNLNWSHCSFTSCSWHIPRAMTCLSLAKPWTSTGIRLNVVHVNIAADISASLQGLSLIRPRTNSQNTLEWNCAIGRATCFNCNFFTYRQVCIQRNSQYIILRIYHSRYRVYTMDKRNLVWTKPLLRPLTLVSAFVVINTMYVAVFFYNSCTWD